MMENQTLLSKRILSIDILRGLVMVIMALDHTRDFLHIGAMTADPLDPQTTTGMLFFTRWITHFCAPTFVFLSGLSAYLSAQSKGNPKSGTFLIKRGIWLIAVEIVVITFGLTFNPSYNFVILQVIWAIGCSMVLLGLASKVSYKFVLITGLILVFGHNIFNLFPAPANPSLAFLLKVMVTALGAVLPVGHNHLVAFFYAILPWTGIMFLGYAAGYWFKKDFSFVKRRRNLLLAGSLTLVFFIAIRAINLYGDPSPRKDFHDVFKNLLSFFNVTKYPPSLAYTSMTIGVALILLAWFEGLKNKLSKILSVYGSVPFFYYVIHFYVLHLILIAVFFATGYKVDQIVQVPFYFRPVSLGFNLGLVYLIWFMVVTALYWPSKWFKKYKESHNQWWLRYV